MSLAGLSHDGNEVVGYRDGMRLRIRALAADRRATLETTIWDLYTRDLGFGPNDDLVVIDIGAHIGTFSVSTAWRYQRCRVYSYEPLKENFELLLANIDENKIDRIFPFMLAVAAKKGRATLHVSKDNTGGHSMFFARDSDVSIETISLAEVFSSNGLDRCDLLKIDCEGAEYDILFNTPPSVLGQIRNIVLEYHNFGNRTGGEIADFLSERGFSVSFAGKPRSERNAIGLLRATRIHS